MLRALDHGSNALLFFKVSRPLMSDECYVKLHIFGGFTGSLVSLPFF